MRQRSDLGLHMLEGGREREREGGREGGRGRETNTCYCTRGQGCRHSYSQVFVLRSSLCEVQASMPLPGEYIERTLSDTYNVYTCMCMYNTMYMYMYTYAYVQCTCIVNTHSSRLKYRCMSSVSLPYLQNENRISTLMSYCVYMHVHVHYRQLTVQEIVSCRLFRWWCHVHLVGVRRGEGCVWVCGEGKW